LDFVDPDGSNSVVAKLEAKAEDDAAAALASLTGAPLHDEPEAEPEPEPAPAPPSAPAEENGEDEEEDMQAEESDEVRRAPMSVHTPMPTISASGH
jgi:hypothetical protein